MYWSEKYKVFSSCDDPVLLIAFVPIIVYYNQNVTINIRI